MKTPNPSPEKAPRRPTTRAFDAAWLPLFFMSMFGIVDPFASEAATAPVFSAPVAEPVFAPVVAQPAVAEPAIAEPAIAEPGPRIATVVTPVVTTREGSGCVEEVDSGVASTSTGSPSQGRLRGADFLNESRVLRHVDAEQCAFWGTSDLVQMLERVAHEVNRQAPDARLTVGELSLERGGDIRGHSSHENGRDADLGFYFVDAAGRAVEPSRLIDVRADGTATYRGRTVYFDAARNWAMLESLLTDPGADLQIALVGESVRALVIEEAQRQGVSRDLLVRAARVMVIPRAGQHPHLNHFHVRIFCAEDAAGCEDPRALWEWTEAARAERA